MRKSDKIAIAFILSPLVFMGAFIAKDYVRHRKDMAALQLEIDAKRYATTQVLKMFLEGREFKNKDEMESEWQFAYMNYRAHH